MTFPTRTLLWTLTRDLWSPYEPFATAEEQNLMYLYGRTRRLVGCDMMYHLSTLILRGLDNVKNIIVQARPKPRLLQVTDGMRGQ